MMNASDGDGPGGEEAGVEVNLTPSHDIEVQEASPESNGYYKSSDGGSGGRRKLYALGCILTLMVIATLCIVLPLTLMDSNGGSSTIDSSADMVAANAADEEQSNIPQDDVGKETPTVTSTSNSDSDTYEFSTVTTTTTSGSSGSTVTVTTIDKPQETETESETEENTKPTSTTVNKEGDETPDKQQTNTNGAADAGDGSTGTALLVGPDATLPLWGSGLTDGYSNDNEFERALVIAFRQQAHTIIEQNIRNHQYQQQWEQNYGGGNHPPVAMPGMVEDGDFAEMAFDEADGGGGMMADSAPAAGGSGGGGVEKETSGVTDFGTNNQEENIDEADLIKADANYVYASYGDYIIIWDTAGNKVGQVQMPPIPPKEEKPQETTTQTEKKPSQAKSIWAPDQFYQPKPHINAMLLTSNHLVALVDGYNNDWHYNWGNSPRENIMSSYRATQIRLYEKNTNTGTPGNLTFVASKDVNGNYVDARSIGNVVHLMTASGVDTWTHLGYPLDWWYLSNGTQISLEEYTQRANKLADTVVPKIAKKFVEEIRLDDGTLPTLLQISQWMSHTNTTDDGTAEHSTTSGPGFSLPYYQDYNVVSNVGQVTSFNVNSPLQGGDTDELTTTASAFMAPSYFNTLYGTDNYLVLATSGWDWNPTIREGEQTTYVVALEIKEDDTTTFKSVGTLPGHLLNSYALDIVNDELRAATTVERFPNWWFGWNDPVPMPFFEDDVDVMEEIPLESEPIEAQEEEEEEEPAVVSGELEALQEETTEGGDGGGRRRLRRHLKKATAEATTTRKLNECPEPDGNECVSDKTYEDCMELVDAGCTKIAILESCPLKFACDVSATGALADTSTTQGEDILQEEPDADVLPPGPPPGGATDPDESRTSNYMTVLKLIGEGVPAGQMSQKGQVKIGEKHERITSVRFFDNVAYAVTFERTDPFYVLDMSVPKVLGELKLPGFSSYLHSMNADNTLLLAVGQNATDDGRETGLMVTVFDATTPSDPRALVSHTFENDDSAYSGSSVQWDYKAFRYVDGKLVVPLEIWYSQQWDPVAQELLPIPEGAENFRGFAVLDVSTTAITEKYRISHMKPDGTCYYCDGGWIPQRSFVYSGDLMTVQEGVVVSTGLDSGEEKWRFTISVEGEPADCCW